MESQAGTTFTHRPTLKNLIIRSCTPDELAFVKNSWFRSFRESSGIRPDVYAKGMNHRIDKLCQTCPPIVAVLESAPDEVLGWICRDTSTIHYVYTKLAFRRAKIATALIIGAQSFTHRTSAGDALFKPTGAVFNPFILEM